MKLFLFSIFLLHPISYAQLQSERSKDLKFGDDVVEGLNKQPLDSLSQISDQGKKRKKLRLYEKRENFFQYTGEASRLSKIQPK